MAARYRATEPRVRQCGTSLNRGWGSRAHDAGDAEPARREPRPPIAATCGPEHASHVPIAKGGNRMSNARPRSRLLHLFLPVAVLAMLLAACGGSASAPILSTVGSAVDSSGESGAVPQAAAASEAPAAAEDAVGQPPDKSGGQPPSAPRDDLKIVYTGSLELVVDDLQAVARQGQDRRARHRRLHRRLAGGQRRRPLRRHHHLPRPGLPLGGRPRRRCAASRPRSWASRPRRPRSAGSWSTSRPGSGTCAPASRSSSTSPRAPARSPTSSRSRRGSPTSAARSSSSTASGCSCRTRSPTGRS